MSRYYNIYSEDKLYHFGIKGMKWGVRRYQNEDGTYTTNGKKRRIKSRISDIKKVQKNRAKTTDINSMSTKEIDDLNHRINSENTYMKNISSKGHESIKETLSASGRTVLKAVATGVGIYAAQKIVSTIIDENAGAMIKLPKK